MKSMSMDRRGGLRVRKDMGHRVEEQKDRRRRREKRTGQETCRLRTSFVAGGKGKGWSVRVLLRLGAGSRVGDAAAGGEESALPTAGAQARGAGVMGLGEGGRVRREGAGAQARRSEYGGELRVAGGAEAGGGRPELSDGLPRSERELLDRLRGAAPPLGSFLGWKKLHRESRGVRSRPQLMQVAGEEGGRKEGRGRGRRRGGKGVTSPRRQAGSSRSSISGIDLRRHTRHDSPSRD